ncbi:COG1361 S-layer family protein [Methanocrinis sp.]|uniref:COG1361 S-layer family protein n=1 Tax=Methanocrinis sp. TaxID=3101522 RepID=UPI003D122F91
MRKIVDLGLLAAFLFIALFGPTPAGASENYIPSVSLDNYWTAFGSPQLDASLAGTNEFKRGDTVTLYVDLTNYGRIMGFKADKKADTLMEQALADREFDYERERTTALGIIGTLLSSSGLIEVKSGDQLIEALRSGEKSRDPMKFSIKISSHAPAGEYPLQLRLSYDYQYNAEVDANELDSKVGLRGFQSSFWYERANTTITIPVFVKRESDFEIAEVEAELSAGEKDGIIEVTYKNIGEEEASDAIARLSVFKPFSSTDDQAYIGSLAPGEERRVKFKIDVDSDATAKPYSINSEIKYTDLLGETVISESMKIPVNVNPADRSYTLPGVVALILVVAAGAYIFRRRKRG